MKPKIRAMNQIEAVFIFNAFRHLYPMVAMIDTNDGDYGGIYQAVKIQAEQIPRLNRSNKGKC
jgi:hypothetical protein